jgi:small subunit ribosomal protein S7
VPRREVPAKREAQPDPIYNNKLVGKFVNAMMTQGKKSLAESIFTKTMKIIEEKMGSDSLKFFKQAIDNVKPVLEGGTKTCPGHALDHRICT